MSGITRPVGGTGVRIDVRRAHPVLTQLGLLLVAAAITAGTVWLTSAVVQRWS